MDVEITVEGVGATRCNEALIPGPPYEVRFEVRRGSTWPDCQLVATVAGSPVFFIRTTEPRLKALFTQLLHDVT